MDFKKIKLIIWDLDNTFWNGTISEVDIQAIQKNNDLIISLTDCGIINSICSKNTFEVAADKLKALGVFEYFVFPSIEWTPKGQRIRSLIKTMGLRAENVLFIDDEITNLEEAKHYSPEIMVGNPEIIEELYAFVSSLEKKDVTHSRLEQYKLLEQKNQEQKKYDSNEEFLYASEIQVTISEDCLLEIERIHELILRSNQLNYTKKRITIEELFDLLNNNQAKCAYISVSDKFGDYGIVGFYALIDNHLEHFLFSCRTIGQGIEQYVYAKLGFPNLVVVGDVTSFVSMNDAPKWINQSLSSNEKTLATNESIIDNKNHTKILIKGPCDLLQTMAYIKHNGSINSEFTYVEKVKANIIDAQNHSVHILGLKEYSTAEKQEIINDCIFVDSEMLKGSFFDGNYDIIFLSTLIESNHGIYQKKDNPKIKVVFGEFTYSLNDSQYWDDYVSGAVHNANNSFTLDYLKDFSLKYSYVGKTEPSDYIKRLKKMLEYLGSQTTLCLIIGVELAYEKNTNPAYINRHIYHKELNQAIRAFAKENSQIKIIDINDYVKSQSDFTNNINHYTARVYYEISQDIIKVINEKSLIKVGNLSAIYVFLDTIMAKLRTILKSMLGNNQNGLYIWFKNIYLKLSRKKRK